MRARLRGATTEVASPTLYRSETLPPAAEVTWMAPSAMPNRTGVRIHMGWRVRTRRRIHARRRIDRILINHDRRRRYNNRSVNHDRSRLLDNDRRRCSVLVAWNFAIGSYRQIGGQCWRGKS